MLSRHLRTTCILAAATLSLAGASLLSQPAEAFCGFYVSGATGDLTNAATMTVMMREGMRTVLSMQNNYQGPPGDFAMVIPVPVVLKEQEVKTLPPEIFAKVDSMAAPRLVEYWEQDPCAPEVKYELERRRGAMPVPSSAPRLTDAPGGLVKIEAQFKVGEYEIVILSAKESTALDGWLRSNKYNIPKGAEEVLRPYVEGGMYFFVAKVDVSKVKKEGDRLKLSPLRFHYDTKNFELPIRLGLLNADGPQDLLVHILARNQRYEVANYPNATLPTNLDVDDKVRDGFGGFINALYDKTQQKHPRAVITEYAWDASTCDPCPGPNLNGQDFLTLGADVLPGTPQYGFVLTRLHARYTKAQATEDLVFKAAPPIVGGREFLQADINELEQGAKPSSVNNFQGRYAIRHVWEGEITCQEPNRGRWGGPPGGTPQPKPTAAGEVAFAPKQSAPLASLVRRSAPEIDLVAKVTTKDIMEKKVATDATLAPIAQPGSAEAPATVQQPVTEGGGEAPPKAEGSKACAVSSPGQRGGAPWELLVAAGAALVGVARARR